MKKIRESNIEILRIIAMLLIIASHYSGWIMPEFPTEAISFNRIFNQILCTGGGIGNILFFLIAGYFFGNFSKKKLFILWLEIIFYSVGGFLISHIIMGGNLSIRLLIAAVLPLSYGEYWFMTEYFMLMILMPHVSILINSMDKRSYQKLLLWLFIFSSVIPSIPGCPTTGISDLGFYLFMYLLGLYTRKYSNAYIESVKINMFTLLASLSAVICSIVCFDLLGKEIGFFAENAGYFGRIRSPFIILFSLSLFNLFKKVRLKNSNIINYISGSVLAVYLLHNNKNLREYMWKAIFKEVELNSPFLFINMVISVMAIFVCCVLIDILRRELIERFVLKLIDNFSNSSKKLI